MRMHPRARFLSFSLLALACTGSADRANDAPAGADPAATVARQALPSGIDPRMVEWRSDGVLIPSMDSLRKTPGYVVDSIFPPAEALRRLQATVPGTAPTRLTGGAADRDALLRHYWTLLVDQDTLAIRDLVVSHAEFAYLYLPESEVFAAGMQPSAAWILYESQTGRGLTRAFAAARGRDAAVIASVCRDRQRQEGKSFTYGPCGVVVKGATRPDTIWIGGTLIRRDGVHKFLGLDSPL